jgi:hypothetical protein
MSPAEIKRRAGAILAETDGEQYARETGRRALRSGALAQEARQRKMEPATSTDDPKSS